MKTLLALTVCIALACTPEKKVDRPSMDPGRVDDQCGDSSPGCPKDSVVVDSSQASIYHPASYEADGIVFAAVDSSTYTINFYLSTLRTGDTAQVKLVRDSVGSIVKRVSMTKNFFTKSGKAVFKVDKILGTKAKYTSCVRARKTAVLSENCVSWFTNFAGTPPPVVDSQQIDSTLALAKLDLKPDNVKLEFGQKQQFCAFIVFKDGKVALRTQDKGIPDCDQYYKEFTLVQRDLTIKQQQAADSMCVKWQTTGGTITAEICGPPNPLVGHPA